MAPRCAFIALALVVLFVSCSVEAGRAVPPLEGYVATPGGWRHQSCLHELPAGHRVLVTKENRVFFVEIQTGKVVKEIEECGKDTLVNDGDGWQAWTWDNRSSPWTAFNATFSIPQAPTYSGQLLYAFTGLQDSCCGLGMCTNGTAKYSHQEYREITGADGKTRRYRVQAPQCNIIQPVLQFGEGPAGGGGYWSITNWFILGWRNIFTPATKVTGGNNVFGTMNIMTNGTWDIGFTEVETGINANLPVTNFQVPDQYVAYCTVETYGVESQCLMYPEQPINFYGMTGAVANQATTFQWTPTRAYYDCEQVATVSPGGNVTINW